MKMPLRVLIFTVATILAVSAWGWYLRGLSHSAERSGGVSAGRLANGIEVRIGALPDEQQQALRSLDAIAGRITLDRIPKGSRAQTNVVIRRRGKPDEQHLAMVPADYAAHGDYTLCIIPLGTNLQQADKLKIVVVLKSGAGTCSLPQIFNNPFKGRWGIDENFSVSEDETGITLMAGTRKNRVPIPKGDIEAEIRFAVELEIAPTGR